MNKEYKKIAAKCAREGKTKLELMLLVPSATIAEAREINLFFEVSKEIINLSKAGKSEDVLRKTIIRFGFEGDDLELILGKKEIKHVVSSYASMLVSLVFVLLFVFVFGTMFLNIVSQTDWDFLKKDYLVTGFVFGEDTNFDDLKITSNAVLKNVLIKGNEYSAVIRCSKELTLSFKKSGFVPVHKNISCEEQKVDVVFATMNEYVKLDLNRVTNVEDEGVKLDINAKDLVVIGTNTPAINPKVSVTAFNPNTPGDMQYFPGELEGLREDGNVTAIESYGFAKIIAEDENGNSLDFKNGTSAKLTFPIDEKQRANAPEEIPLWYFDEIKGIWVEEGLAKKVCNGNACLYVGEMNKVRSSWNADHPVPTYTKDINDWNASGDKKCPKERPVEIYGFVYGVNDYLKGGRNEQYICCPEGTTKNSAVFSSGKPVACSCSDATPKRFFVTESATTICCPKDSKVMSGAFYSSPEAFKCGKCGYGPNDAPTSMACEGECTICRGETIVKLNSANSEKCDEENVKDCSKEGKVCVEHVSKILGDPSAACECPDSATFVTTTEDFHIYLADGYDYLERPLNVGGYTSSNTFFTLSSALEVFEKVSRMCKSECKKKIRLIFANHGSPSGGTQYFGNAPFNLRQINLVSQTAQAGGYDFSCVSQVIWAGCYVGSGAMGQMFLDASQNAFGADSVGASCSVGRYLGDQQDRINLGSIVHSAPNGSSQEVHTIFYASAQNLFFPGITNEAYQTEVLSGEIGKVNVYVNSKDIFRNKLIYLDDSDFGCFKKVAQSKTFTINSSTTSLVMDNFRIDIPLGAVTFGETVTLKVNKLLVDCNTLEKDYWGTPVKIDSQTLSDAKDSFDLNLISEESYIHSKTLFENNWVCIDDSDCFGPCPMGDLNCSYSCTQSHECKINSNISDLRYVPSTSTISDDGVGNRNNDSNTNSKLFSPNNKYSFIILSQSVAKKNVKFEDIGKKISFSYAGSVSPRIAFTINNVPSTPKNWNEIPTRGAVFDGYSLNNCSLWEGYPTDLADCITGYDSLFGLNVTEAIDYASKLNSSAKDKGIIFTKLADYYQDVSFCYPALKWDYYSGLACIKVADSEKIIDSNINISNILNQKLGNYELSFVLRNLSEYYWDINYCYPIPTQSQREACIGRFPKPPEPPVIPVLCGNGVIDEKEKCDGNNFGELSCETFGFNSGKLFCTKCQINKSGCYNYYKPEEPDEPDENEPDEPEPVCGNNMMEGNEDCDGTDFDGLTCSDYGFNSGNLVCENCRINADGCVNVTTQVCGNTVIEGNEECEGTNFNGRTCETYGFNSGTLSCSACKINKTNCKTIIAPPKEIDPLEIFDCNYDGKYASPIKDKANNNFWIKVIKDSKIFAFKIPFKKSECIGESVLTEDANGLIIPCITQVADSDGCIIEKRELGAITDPSDKYIEIGKYQTKYKQNPVDFIGKDGMVYFLTKNSGKHEFVKFSPQNTEINERIQVYAESDYNKRVVPIVMRAMASGDVIWIVLYGSLYNMYIAPGNYGVMECRGYSGSVYGGCNNAMWGENNCYGKLYGDGIVFISKNYSGEEISRVRNEVYCDWHREDVLDSHTGEASISGYSFDPTKMTYKEDGYGNLVVRMKDKIVEYSTDSKDANSPSVVR